MKKFCAYLVVAITTVCLASAQEPTTKVQFAHNAADPAASTLDIYLNDELYLDNFAFRTSTEFRVFTAGTEQRIGIAPATSTSASEVIASFAFTFVANSRNTLMIEGVLTPASFASNTDPHARPLSISAQQIGDVREAGINPSLVDVIMRHGSTDVGAIDVSAGAAKLVNALSYGSTSAYFNVIVGSVPFAVYDAGGALIETYRGDLGDRSGQALMLVTSGFLTPAINQNGPAFGLYFIDAEGGPFIPLQPQSAAERAYVQFVNNVADVDHTKFDIWVNDVRIVNDLAFRTATPRMPLTPNTPVQIAITASDASTSANALVSTSLTLTPTLHMMVINGLVSTSGYAANTDPNAQPIGIALHHANDLKPGVSPDRAEILTMNGTTDAPALDFVINQQQPSNAVSYGHFGTYTAIAPELGTIGVGPVVGQKLGQYNVDFTSFAGKAFAAITTGFMNPAENKGGARATVMLVFDNGGTVILNDVLADVDAGDDAVQKTRLHVTPNPASDVATLTYDLETDARMVIAVYDAMGRRVSLRDMGLHSAGAVHATLECGTLANGMYNVLIEAGYLRTSIPLWILK